MGNAMRKMLRLRVIILVAFILAGTVACTSRGPKVTVGDCISPVDGMQTWKITKVDGAEIYGEVVAPREHVSGEKAVPPRMHYIKSPCP
jgi:hypothetical protein